MPKIEDRERINKIVKVCMSPEDFAFENLGVSLESDIQRMKEYVECVRRVERLSRPPNIKSIDKN